MNAFVVRIWNTCMKSRFLWVKGVGHKKAGGSDVNSTLCLCYSRHCKSINGAQRPPQCCSIFLLIFKKIETRGRRGKSKLFMVFYVVVTTRFYLFLWSCGGFCGSVFPPRQRDRIGMFPSQRWNILFLTLKGGKTRKWLLLEKKYKYNRGTREMRLSACSQQCSMKT